MPCRPSSSISTAPQKPPGGSLLSPLPTLTLLLSPPSPRRITFVDSRRSMGTVVPLQLPIPGKRRKVKTTKKLHLPKSPAVEFPPPLPCLLRETTIGCLAKLRVARAVSGQSWSRLANEERGRACGAGWGGGTLGVAVVSRWRMWPRG